MFALRGILLVLIGSMAPGVTPSMAHPIGMGPDGAGQFATTTACTRAPDPPGSPVTCVVGDRSAPVGVAANPQAPNWIKTFDFSQERIRILQGEEIFIVEHLTVGQDNLPGLNWRDWHELIVRTDPDSVFVWTAGRLIARDPGGGDAQVTGEISGQLMEFDGFELNPGALVIIVKTLMCMGRPICQADLVIREWPTVDVPAPATAALLALGFGALGFSRRRRRGRG